MQWFQPLEQTPRYRTLVNSYLTFIAEQGLAVTALAAFAGLCVWHGSAGNESTGARLIVVAGLRGSVVAFLVAGFFTTTMEEPKLWLIPAICFIGLTATAIRGYKAIRLGAVVRWAVVAAALGCATLWFSGWILARNDALKITAKGESISILPAKSAPLCQVQFAVDQSVMGRDYGKLVRRLALGERMAITATVGKAPLTSCDILVLTGDTVETASPPTAAALVLIAPTAFSLESANRLLGGVRRGAVLLPSFDEDGRVRFWEELLRDAKPATAMQSEALDGVGTQVEWAWEQVMACVHRLK